ncbi:MAG: hypothetical protein HY000_08500 [Planctomycetes bacterium]|nr:hypothetical protein [Planctomycetota bacterium]
MRVRTLSLICAVAVGFTTAGAGQELPSHSVEGQPLAANVVRLMTALELLGSALPEQTRAELQQAADSRDAARLQRLLDPHVLLAVMINPESRVKVVRGPAKGVLQQAGYTPVVVKVINESTVTKPLRIVSPQAGPPYSGVAELSMQRQQQMELHDSRAGGSGLGRFLHVEMFSDPPMTGNLSGLEVEYAIALIYGSEASKREATRPRIPRPDAGGAGSIERTGGNRPRVAALDQPA